MNMAPELALAGAGAYSGNNAMLAMGAISAAEKMGDSEDKEDRIRAGILQNVPAPMGYMGGPQAQTVPKPLPPSKVGLSICHEHDERPSCGQWPPARIADDDLQRLQQAH